MHFDILLEQFAELHKMYKEESGKKKPSPWKLLNLEARVKTLSRKIRNYGTGTVLELTVKLRRSTDNTLWGAKIVLVDVTDVRDKWDKIVKVKLAQSVQYKYYKLVEIQSHRYINTGIFLPY